MQAYNDLPILSLAKFKIQNEELKSMQGTKSNLNNISNWFKNMSVSNSVSAANTSRTYTKSYIRSKVHA